MEHGTSDPLSDIYLAAMTIIGSVIVYGARNLTYIDCLFHAAGGATQSGLNTVNLNEIYTYQQVTLMLLACLCNPIVINTFVVFVRLYWFEKRFQHVVRQASEFRRHRTRSRTKTEERKDLDFDQEERGVGNRTINVLRNETSHKIEGDVKEEVTGTDRHGSDRIESNGDVFTNAIKADGEGDGSSVPPGADVISPTSHRDIIWADDLQTPTRDVPNEERLPEQRSHEQHIAFVENQRYPKETGALRIPGPREWDRGDLPERVEDNERQQSMSRRASIDPDRHGQVNLNHADELNADDHPIRQAHEPFVKRLQRVLSLARKGPGREDSPDPTIRIRQRVRSRTRSIASFLSQQREGEDPIPYLSYAPTIGRNSYFIDLTEEQREELGGIEYRALKTLAWILLVYFFGWSVLGIIIYEPWIHNAPYYKDIIRSDGQGVPWWAIYTPMSSFTDLGFTVTPDSMNSFNEAAMPLIMGAFLIVIGNTGFPCMLRFLIWLGSRLVPYGSSIWEELRFLLDHPRRCFTLLFPRKATWWLFAVLIILNGIDLIFYIILDLHDTTVTDVPGGYQFLDGLFQAASTRTAGFSVVNLANLHPAIQVSYLIMMYISVFPIAISVRQTNVYEEKSLGIYGDHSSDDGEDENSEKSYLGFHLRRQLSFDLWYVFLGLFLVCIIEGDRLQDLNQSSFTIFVCLFEIVSAYGTVGLSLGYPGIDASFSAELRTLSKLIIVAMMLRGRHRGLPYALDRAILLPSESLNRKEQEEAEHRAQRRASRMSAGFGDGEGIAFASGAAGQAALADHRGLGNLPMAGENGAGSNRRESVMTVESMERGRRKSRPAPVHALQKVISGALSAGPGYSAKKRS